MCKDYLSVLGDHKDREEKNHFIIFKLHSSIPNPIETVLSN